MKPFSHRAMALPLSQNQRQIVDPMISLMADGQFDGQFRANSSART
jgi:hypothetical protein